MADLGLNQVRLGVMWEAVETSPGVYNETYLKRINDTINALGEKGIYTLVDTHQDVLARVICGEGMPDFYAKEVLAKGSYCVGSVVDIALKPAYLASGFCKSISSYNFKKDKNGNPLISECQKNPFFNYYLSPESLTLFRAIYENKMGM